MSDETRMTPRLPVPTICVLPPTPVSPMCVGMKRDLDTIATARELFGTGKRRSAQIWRVVGRRWHFRYGDTSGIGVVI